jgi:hypothetical protein
MLETSTLQKAMDLSRATIPSLDLQQKNRKTTSHCQLLPQVSGQKTTKQANSLYYEKTTKMHTTQEEANSPLLGPQIRIANNSSI